MNPREDKPIKYTHNHCEYGKPNVKVKDNLPILKAGNNRLFAIDVDIDKRKKIRIQTPAAAKLTQKKNELITIENQYWLHDNNLDENEKVRVPGGLKIRKASYHRSLVKYEGIERRIESIDNGRRRINNARKKMERNEETSSPPKPKKRHIEQEVDSQNSLCSATITMPENTQLDEKKNDLDYDNVHDFLPPLSSKFSRNDDDKTMFTNLNIFFLQSEKRRIEQEAFADLPSENPPSSITVTMPENTQANETELSNFNPLLDDKDEFTFKLT